MHAVLTLTILVGLISTFQPGATRFPSTQSEFATWATYSNYDQGYRLRHPANWKPHTFKNGQEFLYFFETPDLGPVVCEIDLDTTTRDVRKAFDKRRVALEASEPRLYDTSRANFTTVTQGRAVLIPMRGDATYQEEAMLVEFGGGVLSMRYRTSGVRDTVGRILSSLVEIQEAAVTTLTISPRTVHIGDPFEIKIVVRNVGQDPIELGFGSLCVYGVLFAGKMMFTCSDAITHVSIAPGQSVCQRLALRVSNNGGGLEYTHDRECPSQNDGGAMVTWPTAFGKIAPGVYEFRGGLMGYELRFPWASDSLVVVDGK